MPNTNPTIVSASLSDKELQDSINKMVANFDKGLQDMLDHSNKYVEKIQESLQKIGNTNFGTKGSNDGAVVKQTKAQNDFTDAVEKNIAARDKQIKKNQEATTSFDNFAKAQQVAIRSASPSGIRNAEELQTMNIQLDLLRERLREARQQYSSFVALAAHATTTGDKGLFQYATDGVHRYEQEVRNLIPQIRTLQSGIRQMGDVIAPQGHTIQNYVNSLQKANPELAALNAQYKSGTSLLQDQSTSYASATQSAQRYTEEIRKQAAAIRATKEWQEKGRYRIGEASFYDPETSRLAKKDIISLEEQILQWKRKQTEETEKATRAEYQYSDAVRNAADALRAQLRGTKAASIDVGGRTIYNEKDAGSIESQLTALVKDRTKEFNLQHEVALAIEQDEKRIGEELLKQRQTSDGTKKTKEAETYRQMIAKTLGIQESQVKLANAETASYEQLDATLKQLIRTKNKLGSEGLKSAFGKGILEDIKEVEAAMQRIKKFGYNKVALSDALGLSEKSLDDIARKSQQLQYVMRNVDTTTEEGARAFQRAALNARLLKEKENELLSKNSQLMSSNNSLIASNTALGRSWNYMKNRLAFYFTVGASTQFVKNLIEIRSQYEMTERALGILVNSAEKGTQIFNELSQMALVSPYTLIELSGAAKQLVAYDVAAKDVVDTTRRLADMASAVGVPMERLTYALGQIKVYGYLNSRDNRMFANAGIPLVKQLADYYTELEGKLVSTADVYDRIKKKAVGYADVMQVITKMTDEGGKFFDFQEKMSGTLKVQIANLTLAWNNMLNEIGASEQGILTTGIATLKNLFLAWKDLSNILTTIAAIFGIVKAQQILSNIAIGKSTVSLIGYINANKEATWVEYSRALQTKKLTATQAAWLLMTNKNNAALAASLVRLKIIDAATARYLTTMKGLSAGLLQLRIMGTMALNGLAKGVKALGAAFMTNLPLVALTAAIDLFTHFSSVASNNKSFNESIATGANEASEALRNFMKEDDKVQARAKAASGNLSDTEAKKVWEAIREQIELSSQAANVFIPQLLSITNINERVTAAFDLADKIQEATNKLGELRDEMEVSQDSWLWGLFGEGIGEDLDDYNKRVKELREQAKYFAEGETSVWEDLKIAINGVWDGIGGGSGSQGAKEAVREIEKFANNAADVIKEKLGKEGVLDEKQVTEAVARFVKAAEQQIPEIRGAGKKLFEALTNDIMGKQFEVFNAQEYYYSAFLEQLKKDYGSKFADITEDIKDKTVVWSDAQKKAIKETADKVKKDWPQASRDAIDEILKDLNNTEFKLHLVTTFSSDLTDFQQQFNTRANKLGMIIADTLQKFAPKSGDDLPSWTKKQQESIKALREENKDYEKDNSKWAKQRIAANNTEIEGRTKALSLFKQSAISDKDSAKNKKQAESELQKALKDELSTIDKVRSIYKDLTKEGMSHANAVERATRGWYETVNAINRVLQKNGLQKLDLSKFAGIENPRELLNILQSQLETLVKRGASTSEIRVLQTKIQTVSVEADKYDLTMITKGLNNELGKLKDEYELAVELDANPELGGIFADYMGIDMNELPKNAEEAAKKAQKYIDKILRENKSKEKIDIASLMGKDAFDKWIKSSGHSMEDDLVKIVDNYRQALHKMQVDESKKQMQEWEKLLEKYAEYEYKVVQIQKEAEREREIARKKGASQEILDAINNREKQEIARVSFEEFQKSPEWIVATGDLANMSKSAIGMLIEQIEKYKRSAKNLSPKQIKQLNSALSKLYKEQRKDNPFKAISNMLDEAKERMATFDEDIKKTQEEIDNLTKKKKESIVEGVADEETDNKLKKAIKRLKELKKAREETGKVDASSWVSSINETIGAVKSAIGVFDDLAKAIGGVNNSDIDKVFSVLDKAGQGAAIGAQIGGAWGAVIGGVVGAATSLISIFAGAANERITAKVEESERAVKRLELAYIDLEHAVQQAYGMATIGANMAAKANKELQLVELKRQLALERSRDSKHRDEDRIIDLQKQIKELEYDIADTVDSIVNDLLGISSIGDAMENMMDAFIEALRSGEDAMATFDESVDEMIANMVKKMFTTKILQPWFEEQWNKIQDQINERAGKLPDELAKVQSKVSVAKMADLDDNGSLVEALRALGMNDEQIHRLIWFNEFGQSDNGEGRNARLRAAYEKLLKEAEQKESELQKELATATMPTTDDIRQYAELLRSGQPIMEENMQEVANFLRELGLMKDDANKNLSALQQGLQSMSEDTGSALESYMNGVSQQVYYHSSLLEQIRDSVVGLDLDVSLGVQSQMLLQLQNSYQTQQAIQQILEGVLVPSGRAFAVELLS